MSGEIDRRTFMGTVGLGGLAAATGGASALGAGAVPAAASSSGDYLLPPLPYDYDALKGFLSKALLTLHHDRHHAGYVRGLNSTIAQLAAARKTGDLGGITALSRSLAFHGSGHVLHALYWSNMSPQGGGTPKGALANRMAVDFGSFEAFRAQFAAASKAVEGSGWGILAWEPLGKRLVVLQCEKHQDLTLWGAVPLLVCDVWEHAYYLDYQNDRGAYVDKFFEVINWSDVARRFDAAAK